MLGACVVFCSAVAAAQQVTISDFRVPTPNSAPTGITSAADGTLWFTEQNANKVARMTPAGVFAEYAIPTAASTPEGITATADGYLWFTEFNGHKIGRISQYGGAITEFAVPFGGFPTAITHLNGEVWFAFTQQPNLETGVSQLASISSTGAITILSTGQTLTYVTALTAAAGGILWLTQISSSRGDSVAKVSAGSGAVTNFPLPNPSATPQSITVGPDNALWFTESNIDRIGRITNSGVLEQFPVAAGSTPQQIASAAGDLWFTERGSNRIGRMTVSGQASEFAVPTSSSQPFGITSDLHGHLYFTEQSGDKIGKIVP
jgi:virginiamycin B lyase